jgi:hypothetical protein
LKRKARLGWLGPVIALVGIAVGGVGIWWMVHARPEPGRVIDALALDGEWAVVVRAETGSDRAFVELVSTARGALWQAMVPRYAGAPGAPAVAAGKAAVSVRVVRTQPEVWALSTIDATKLGGITLDGYADGAWLRDGPSRVVTAGEGTRSYEVVDGTRGATVVGIDLSKGSVRWHRAVGGAVLRMTPTAAGVEIETTTGGLVLDPDTGAPIAGATPSPAPPPGTLSGALRYDAAARALVRGDARFAWPAWARPPFPYHLAGRFLWLIGDDKLEVLDTEQFTVVGSHGVR